MTAPTDILRAWSAIQPVAVDPIARGTNNRSWQVTTTNGSFILQILLNVTNRDCLAAQHRLLAAIGDLDPGFAVPAPVPADHGTTAVTIDGDPPRLAVLVPVIAGRHPDPTDTCEVAACADALARLHLALARIPDATAATCGSQVGSFASTVGPEALIADLPLHRTPMSDLSDIYRRLSLVLDRCNSTMPAQVIHGDFYPSNVLVTEGRVSGILDFESVSVGPRATDVAIALWAFVYSRSAGDDAWQRAQALIDVYAARLAPRIGEWDALADLIVVREAHSFLHWSKRFLAKLIDADDLEERAQRLIDVDRWAEHNRDRIDRLAGGR